MLKLIGSVMIFGSCAALGLNARRELRRRVAAADAMLLALRLMENEITARRTPMPEIIDLLAKNENAVVRQIFSGVRRRMRERSGLSLSYLWCAGMRAAQADAGLGREECGVLCDAANFLGRYDASERRCLQRRGIHRHRHGAASFADAARAGFCRAARPGQPVPHLRHRGRSARYSGACLKRRGKTMDVDLIFRIAAVGILVAVLGQLLTRSGRDEQALMTTLAGLIVVLMLIVEQISRLFSMMKSVFGF